MSDPSALRERMVRHQVAARGVRNARVLDAMRQVPREAFVPDNLAGHHAQGGHPGHRSVRALTRRGPSRR